MSESESWKPTYADVTAEVQRVHGVSYPREEDFSEEQVAEAVPGLDAYYLTTDVAVLTMADVPPAVMTAFTKLAETLRGTVHPADGALKILRDTTDAERRKSASDKLRSALHVRWRAEAEMTLVAQHQAAAQPA